MIHFKSPSPYTDKIQFLLTGRFFNTQEKGGITLGKLVCGLGTHILLSKPFHLTVPCVLVCPSKTSWQYLQNDCAADPLTATASRPTIRPFLSSLSSDVSLCTFTLSNSLINFTLQPPLDGQCYFVLCWDWASVIDFGNFFTDWNNTVWQMERPEIGPYVLFRESVLYNFDWNDFNLKRSLTTKKRKQLVSR